MSERMLTPEELKDLQEDEKHHSGIKAANMAGCLLHDLQLADQEIAKLKATLEYWKDGTFRCHGCDGTHEMDCPVNDGKQQREVDKLREEVGRLGKVVEAARGVVEDVNKWGTDCYTALEVDKLAQALKDYDDA